MPNMFTGSFYVLQRLNNSCAIYAIYTVVACLVVEPIIREGFDDACQEKGQSCLFVLERYRERSICTREVGLGVRFRVGGLNREPLESREGVKFRLRGLSRASLWGLTGASPTCSLVQTAPPLTHTF